MILLQIFLLVLGFVLLVKGADIFVDGASNTARNFKVPKMLIGLTIIAFGTSAPEFAVSMTSLAGGNSDIVLGNVIGSNILNTLLILGIAALINPIRVQRQTILKELPFCLLFTLVLAALIIDTVLDGAAVNTYTRSDGVITVLFFLVFVYYLVRYAIRSRSADTEEDKPKYNLPISLLLIVLGLVGIVFGSDLVVDSAVEIAGIFGVSQRVISLTIIALGTSLPELVTTIVASRKKEQDLLIGNIIGSNIFNIAIVLGIPAVIFGGVDASSFSIIDLVTCVISAFMIFILSLRGRTVSRKDGALMLFVFVAYYVSVFVI